MSRTTLIITMLIAFACHRNSGHQDPQSEPGHQHSGEAEQCTLFGPNTEFFIEHEPLEAGEESAFLVHVTWLDTYDPCTEGQVTIRIGGKAFSSGHPHTPGIFEIAVIPAAAGLSDLEITLVSGSIAETVTTQVTVYGDHDEMLSAGEPVGEISFLKEQAWKSDFMVSKVEREMISMVIHTSGELISPPGKIKRIRANIGGIVSFADKTLVQGSDVTHGQHLFTLSGKSLPDNNFQLQLQQSANSLEKSRNVYLRHQRLFTQGVVSEKQYQESKSAYAADSLQYYNLAVLASEEGLKVYAPVTGSIHELEVREGDYVETGQGMATISSDRILLLRADLPQQYHAMAGDIHTANFRTAYSREVWSIDAFRGRHLTTGRSVAENDHYLPIYFELENDGRLLEGAFAEIYLKSDAVSVKTAIPVDALLEEQGTHYVYVQLSGETYSKRRVSTGASDGRTIEITDGLAPGERIVSRGAILVKAASAVTGVVGHGHAH
ncbi:MAG: efflux RND transporter periplasmic adaptor subunit [Bacteroidota bacterium]